MLRSITGERHSLVLGGNKQIKRTATASAQSGATPALEQEHMRRIWIVSLRLLIKSMHPCGKKQLPKYRASRLNAVRALGRQRKSPLCFVVASEREILGCAYSSCLISQPRDRSDGNK